MKMPPFIVGSAVLFWGSQTGLWVAAVSAAIILESWRWVSFRLDITLKDFRRGANFCGLILIGMAINYYYSNQGLNALFSITQWFPIVFLPIVAAQLYSSKDEVEAQVFFIFKKLKSEQESRRPPTTIDLLKPYFVICLISAGTANNRTIWFYVGVSALCIWAFWNIRSSRFSSLTWSGLALIAILLGYAGSVGILKAYAFIDVVVVNWIFDRFQSDLDPFKAQTAIGDIGELKLSDKIVYRVKYDIGHTKPILLPQASYNLYKSSYWYASDAPFISMVPERNGSTWKIKPSNNAKRLITITAYLNNGKGLLLAPNQLFQIQKMPVASLDKNRLGTVKVDKGPEFVNYKLKMNPLVSLRGKPDERDLRVPDELELAFGKIVDELGLDRKSPSLIAQAVMKFFEENFSYTLKLKGVQAGQIPLIDFLMRTRQGHCEYFATATVLLLRKAGIPARYVFGYSAHEYDWQEKNLVVRSRNAHSWATAFIDGKWINIDSTPSAWINEEDANASVLEPLVDLWVFMALQFSRWRWNEEEEGEQRNFTPLLIPILMILAWRLYRKTRVTGKKESASLTSPKLVRLGMESDFYRIEKYLNEQGLVRDQGETIMSWLNRIGGEHKNIHFSTISKILEYHYRYRFDPFGLSEKEEVEFKSDIRSWLAAQHTSTN
ncbi:MAG: transglutaminase-like domain-containing protein [Nitrospinales bacterium]